MRQTIKQINAALKAAGYKEELVKGKDYFYFVDGESGKWPEQGVMVYRLNQLSAEQWVHARNELAKRVARWT